MVIKYLTSYSYRLFGRYFKNKRAKYFDLRQELHKTRYNISFDMYLSLAVLCSLVMVALGLLFAVLIVSFLGAPDITLGRSFITDILGGLIEYKNLFLKFISVIVITCVFGGGTFIVFLNYPKLMNSNRKRSIDTMLPYAVHYMSAMSGAGVIPVEIFSSLAKNEIYGEAAVEASYIVRDIKILGNDLVQAMKNVASTTPSYRLQDFLQGAVTIVSSGGDLSSFLKLKADQYVVDSKREQKEFLDTLGLVAETYVTAFVAGPLFLIVMMSVMSIMGGMDIMLMYLLVYVVIPIGSLMFVVLVSSLTPEV